MASGLQSLAAGPGPRVRVGVLDVGCVCAGLRGDLVSIRVQLAACLLELLDGGCGFIALGSRLNLKDANISMVSVPLSHVATWSIAAAAVLGVITRPKNWSWSVLPLVAGIILICRF